MGVTEIACVCCAVLASMLWVDSVHASDRWILTCVDHRIGNQGFRVSGLDGNQGFRVSGLDVGMCGEHLEIKEWV